MFIAIMAILITFAKGLGSLVWAYYARAATKELFDDIGWLVHKKFTEKSKPFFSKPCWELTHKERDLAGWIKSYAESKGLTEAIGIYKRDRGGAIAFVFLTLSYAIFLGIEWIRELSGHNYWSYALFLYIFVAAVCAGAGERCFQCSLRATDAWRNLDGDKIMRGMQLHGNVTEAILTEEASEIHVTGDGDVQVVWDVRGMEIERAIDYVLYGSGQ